ncbi:MAG: adenylate/guanylate cyclase domain-containing protein [Acidobacteria bacterium]|nr:adenylate/guanylate cyclase domain-containing protein [Acidobacteriota bacterium]
MSLLRNPPETQYADTGEGFVAYQTFGQGRDLLFFTDINSNVEVMWEYPAVAQYFDRLSSFTRVTYFDNRGTGVSDPIPYDAITIDNWMDDGRAVLDAAGIEQVALLGDVEGGPTAMLFAATYPHRVSALVLTNAFARWTRAEDYAIGMPAATLDKLMIWLKQNVGKPGYFDALLPSRINDEQLKTSLARFQRTAVPPGIASLAFRWYSQVDLRPILANINVPTLVIARSDATYHRPAHSRYLAEHISEAKLVELPGADTSPYFEADPEPVLDEIEEFLTGVRARPVSDRTLATVMFTDIVDSTGHAARLGDERWLNLLGDHNRLTRDYLHRYRGIERDTAGDGFLATFDGPTRAVTCAAELQRTMPELGIQIRVGLHTGEVELTGNDIGGIAVHIAARVIDAEPGSGVMVSSTVKDLVVGSGIEFEDRGSHQLKGVPDEWHLYAVSGLP